MFGKKEQIKLEKELLNNIEKMDNSTKKELLSFKENIIHLSFKKTRYEITIIICEIITIPSIIASSNITISLKNFQIYNFAIMIILIFCILLCIFLITLSKININYINILLDYYYELTK